MPTSSRRGTEAPSSPIRKLVPYADAARARGLHVYHLNIGQPDIETPPVMRQALKSFDAEVIAYGKSGGDEAVRVFLTDYYGRLDVPLEPHQLLVTTGGSEAIFFAMAACLDPGDEVLVPDPMYANYMGYGTLLGNRVTPLPTSVAQRSLTAPAALKVQRE